MPEINERCVIEFGHDIDGGPFLVGPFDNENEARRHNARYMSPDEGYSIKPLAEPWC